MTPGHSPQGSDRQHMHASLDFLTMLLSNSHSVQAASAQLHLHTVSLHRDKEGCVHPLTQDTEGLQKHAAQHSTAQHNTASTLQRAPYGTAQHSTAQHSTARHSTAQHGTGCKA